MKIALLTMGTRGDVQPFAVLGKALQQRGHDATLATAKNFESFVATYGLKFEPVEADFQEVLNSPEGKKMMSNPFSAKKHFDKLIYPMIYDALKTFYRVARQSDVVLFHVKAMADFFAEHLPGRVIKANVVPAIEPTKEFINPVFSSFGLPRFLNRLSYKLSDLGMKMMRKPINTFRQEIGITTAYKKPHLPAIYGISPSFLTEPEDYPKDSIFTGFWLEESDEQLSQNVIDFINAGAAPLVITFGSMPFESKLNLPVILNSLTEKLKVRLVIIKGWGLKADSMFTDNKNILVLNSAPYDKLFPLAKAVVHHGGIGTIAACLKAGKPFFTCPVLYPLGDQYFWGDVGYKKGVAVKPVALKKLTAGRFFNGVNELLTSTELYNNSQKLMLAMAHENGVDKAIAFIESQCELN